MLTMHPSKPEKVNKKEIYQLAGSSIAAFEYDCENIQNDNDEGECKESLYIFDNAQKIYRLENEDGIKYNVADVIDFSAHNKVKEVK